ncbi:MAG: diguanylate cyclase [Gammaproteobacteria bacterium]|nr:diguanylate cyclase [Gammaproteobacteria bacterium]
MRLIPKTTLLTLAMVTLMVLILVALSLFAFRHFSISSAEKLARTAAEIVRVSLTESMINGVIARRETFLERLEGIEGLRDARVVRGAAVREQHGGGLEREQAHDVIDRKVLATGQPHFEIDESTGEPIFRATIPYVADDRGEPNCMTCHQVERGTVLGAITITISIAKLKEQALQTIGFMQVPVVMLALLLVYLVRRTIVPLGKTADELQVTVHNALRGDFNGHIHAQTRDEIGQIANELNQLMAFLREGLGSINGDVARLTRCEPSEGNQLASTRDMVNRLIDAAHFKQSIEEDETRREVYQRLGRVIREDFGIEHYSIYEVANSKNRMTPVQVDGDEQGECRWCDPQILIRAEACRARRTGHHVDSVASQGICNAFRPGDDVRMRHICLPVIQSGSVGSVVQLVIDEDVGHAVQRAVPYLQVYLREAAPVIEAKRLMDTLRESTLRDPMTGLHNRRFLEEYIETVVASAQRRKAQISVMMLDLDFFKKVNDTHGHDAGDAVLKTLAKVLVENVRSSDLVIRYGGEEFLVILVDTRDQDADEVAEKVRAAVEATKFQVPGGTLQKTISIGVADYPKDGDTFWQAMKYADVALYQAKERGRNRVVHFSPEMWTTDEEY